MLYDDASYFRLLRKIDHMRSLGIPNKDPRMVRLRMKLRDFLEIRRKVKDDKKKKLVPKLTSVKTVTFDGDFSNIMLVPKSDKKLPTKKAKPIKKYVILGTLVAVGGVVWHFFKKAN